MSRGNGFGGFDEGPTPLGVATWGGVIFLLSAALGGVLALLQEAAGRSLGAHTVLWTGFAALGFFVWRAARRYRKLVRRRPAETWVADLERSIDQEERAEGKAPAAPPDASAPESSSPTSSPEPSGPPEPAPPPPSPPEAP